MSDRSKLRPRTTCHTRRGEDDGFTLIELVIVIVILPIVIGGIAAALLAILQNESTTFNRVADSADAQLTSTNFARDVQSASLVTTSSTVVGGQCWPTTSPNWPATPPLNAVPLLGLQWGETITRTFTDGAVQKNDNLFSDNGQAEFTTADVGSTVTDSNGLNDIPSTTTTPPGVTTITQYISPTEVVMSAAAKGSGTGDTVTLTLAKTWVASYWDVPVASGTTTNYELVRQFCETAGVTRFLSSSIVAHDLPATANQGLATVTCGSSVPASQCTPTHGWIPTAGVTSIALSTVEPASGYSFNLSATPRNSDAMSTGVFGLLLTGAGPSLSLYGNNDSLVVDGGLDFNSTSGSAIGVADSSLTVNPVPNQAAISETQCGTSCGAITSSFGGSITCGGSLSCPANTSLSNPIAPPSVPPPLSPTSSGPAGTCSGPPKNVTCTPGYYASLSLPISGNVTFSPGNYTFSSPISVTNGLTISFSSGQYTFDGGLSTGSGVSLITPPGNGVFFYFPVTGSLTADSPGDSLQLIAATTGPYAGILIDQPGNNTSSLSCGGGSATNTLAGDVVAPSAQVTLGLGGDTFTVGTLIASSIAVGSPYVTVTVGS